MKFLEELDSLERKRHEEVQRGVLLRAAKVHSTFANSSFSFFCCVASSQIFNHLSVKMCAVKQPPVIDFIYVLLCCQVR